MLYDHRTEKDRVHDTHRADVYRRGSTRRSVRLEEVTCDVVVW
jgi:hypothetical protein